MGAHDFEIETSLHADELTARVPPAPNTEGEGAFLALERDEARSGIPDMLQPGANYRDICIEKRLWGTNVQ